MSQTNASRNQAVTQKNEIGCTKRTYWSPRRVIWSTLQDLESPEREISGQWAGHLSCLPQLQFEALHGGTSINNEKIINAVFLSNSLLSVNSPCFDRQVCSLPPDLPPRSVISKSQDDQYQHPQVRWQQLQDIQLEMPTNVYQVHEMLLQVSLLGIFPRLMGKDWPIIWSSLNVFFLLINAVILSKQLSVLISSWSDIASHPGPWWRFKWANAYSLQWFCLEAHRCRVGT